MFTGKIIKGIGGFYYIKPDDSLFLSQKTIEAKPRGLFRHKKITPVVGDIVLFSEKNGEYTIEEIKERDNILVRPPVSNVDNALLCLSVDDPKPNLLLLDKLIVNSLSEKIRPVICITKVDLDHDEAERIKKIYSDAGFEVLLLSDREEDDLEKVLETLEGSTTFLAGASGVGKSTLVNRFSPVKMETGETSEKLKRGKHTTRHVELIEVKEDSFILDTPGFSSLELEDLEKEDLKKTYPEFDDRDCRFQNCNHIKEPGCAVREAVKSGEIDKERYRRYVELFKYLEEKKRY